MWTEIPFAWYYRGTRMNTIAIAQIVLSVLLIVLILMQQSEGGMGSMFGGDSADGPQRTRRGAEQFIFVSTLVIAVLFTATSILALLY